MEFEESGDEGESEEENVGVLNIDEDRATQFNIEDLHHKEIIQSQDNKDFISEEICGIYKMDKIKTEHIKDIKENIVKIWPNTNQCDNDFNKNIKINFGLKYLYEMLSFIFL